MSVQFIDEESFGLLPSKSSLSKIPTQDEATAVAASIAQQFGLRFTPGIQARAIPSSSLGEDTFPENSESGLIKPEDKSAGEIDGYIRVRHSKEGNVLTYTKSHITKLATSAFAIIWLGFCLKITSSLLAGSEAEGATFRLLNLAVFWIAGFVMLGSAHNREEFLIKGDRLVYQTSLVGIALKSGRIPLAELGRVGLEVYWDSYNKMHHRVVAQVVLGQDHVLVGNIPEADGHALCMALNRQFGVPV